MKLIKLEDLLIPPRIRQEYDEDGLLDLAEDIAMNGLYNAICVHYNGSTATLVAGERRLRAIAMLYSAGITFTHDGQEIPLDTLPTTDLGELPPDQALEIELNENIKRTDLSVIEQSLAIARLHELRSKQAPAWSPQTFVATAQEIARATGKESDNPSTGVLQVAQAITIARHASDPEVAKATTIKEALKVIDRKVTSEHNRRLAEELGAVVPHERHTLLRGDCIAVSGSMPAAEFDCVLSDPFYGIDAQDFGTQSQEVHKYVDTYEQWRIIMPLMAQSAFRVCKPEAHAYIFCDIRRFEELKQMWRLAGWYVWDTPMIWIKSTGGILPRPDYGPRRTYESILYAIKGDKKIQRVSGDTILTAPSHTTGHAAEKPVELFVDLLSRSCRPGDKVIDFMCGSGTIFPAANKLSLRATGIDDDPESFAIASKRIGEMPK